MKDNAHDEDLKQEEQLDMIEIADDIKGDNAMIMPEEDEPYEQTEATSEQAPLFELDEDDDFELISSPQKSVLTFNTEFKHNQSDAFEIEMIGNDHGT